jgi:flagellin-like protein
VLRAEGALPERGVSPLIATVLLVVSTLVAGGLLVEGLGKLGAPSIPPQTVVQLWTNYPGYGGVAIVHASGEGISKAYRADILEETPMGTLLENIRWANLELRVNGVRVENEIDLALVTGPVKRGMNDLPGPGEALALSFKRGTLRVGDKVELIYTPLGYKVAEATVPEPVPGRQYVDTAIQLRAARLLGRQEETVKAMKEKRFSDARRLAYELQAIARDLHDNYLAYSPYLENNLWELNRYMPDLVSENLCKTLIVIYEGGLPHLINALELIENIMYVWLRVDDPSLLQAVRRYQIENAALCARAIYENVQRVENLRWKSKYYTPLPGENENTPESKIRRMEILYAIPGGFVQDLSRDLYIPFLTPWVESLSMSTSGLSVTMRVYNLGTTRVENIRINMYTWVDNVGAPSGGEDSDWNAKFWVSKFFNKGSTGSRYSGFQKIKVDPIFASKPLFPMYYVDNLGNAEMDLWEHIIWNFGWPRLPYPTKCERQYWWVDEHQLVQRFQNWGLTYDLSENNHPIVEFFWKNNRIAPSAPYMGEGGKAVYVGNPFSRVSPSKTSLDPGGDNLTISYSGTDFLLYCGLDIDDQMALSDVYVVGDDAFWGRKTELAAFAAMYMNAVC